MSEVSPRLGLPYIQPSQAQKHVTHNEALEKLDLLVQGSVRDSAATLPPGAPQPGEAYGIGAGASGVWSGHDGQLAIWTNGAWLFFDAIEGQRIWDQATGELRVWSNGVWAPVLDLEAISQLGINSAADVINRLAVAAPATLLTHEGAGHQLKVNKAATGDTASLLFQSGWSGRAEMGLVGQDDWSIKVSPDGGSWTEALRINAGTGLAHGAALQEGADDATDGRIWRSHGSRGSFGLGAVHALDAVDANALERSGFYRTLNNTLNTPVPHWGHMIWHNQFDQHNAAQIFASGSSDALFFRRKRTGVWANWRPVTPEQGSNANGYYTRFADGTQICGFQVSVAPVAGSVTATAFTFPAEFIYSGGSPGNGIFVTALPVTPLPESSVGQTGLSLSGGTGGVLHTYRSDTMATQYSCMAFGRWY